MSLIVDRTQASAPLDDEGLRAWATTRSAFVSSEMKDLAGERRAVADALTALGMRVVMFEDLGGRDENAQTAYLDGVARSEIYVGIIGNRYGSMTVSGRSPTHEEYREARRLGLRIAVWAGADGNARQGDARDFVGAIRTFHTTGSFTVADDLARSVVARMREIAADDDTPWVKIGDVIFRAESIDDDGRTLVVLARTRDRDVLHALQTMRPDQMRSSRDLPVTTFDNSGSVRISEVAMETLSASMRRLRITGTVEWADGRRSSLAAGLNGITVEQQVEMGLSAGLFGSAASGTSRLAGFVGGFVGSARGSRRAGAAPRRCTNRWRD